MVDNGATRRMAKLTLTAAATAVGCSRAFIRCTLSRWRLGHVVDSAELVASELVTNSIKAVGATGIIPQHAPGGEIQAIQVRLVLAGSLFVGVWDSDVNTPVLREPDLDAESGRGLFLIDAVSKRWGVHRLESGGKVVWSELDCAPPTTKSGLPIRIPGEISAPRVDMEVDPVVLQRVAELLRRL
jgi:hypothetical protein